jgi:exo-beta-1,3-glucanase (GH17 family)
MPVEDAKPTSTSTSTTEYAKPTKEAYKKNNRAAEPLPDAPPTQVVPHTGLGGTGEDHWAIAYNAYQEGAGGGCKSRDEVFADVAKIKGMGFNTLRVYSTDCDTLKNVGDACQEKGLKLIVGVFVKENGCALSGMNKQQVVDLIAWGKWDLVSAAIIGNEAVFGGLCSASQLKGMILGAKDMLSAAGFPGPYMTAETVNVWEQHGDELCGCVDMPGANIHAYFDAGVAPSGAGEFVKKQLEIVSTKCGKKALTTESGWPSEGNANGLAVPGPSQQKQAIDSIRQTCGQDVVFFTYGKRFWMHDSSCNCEPYFNVDASFN